MAPFPDGLPDQKICSLRFIYMATDVQQTTCITPSSIAQRHRSGTSLQLWEYSWHILSNIKYILMLEDDLSRVRKLLVDTVNRNQGNRPRFSAAGITKRDLEDVFKDLCAEMGVTRQEVLKQSYRVGHILGDGRGIQGKGNGRKRKTETALYDDQQLPTDSEDEQRPDTARDNQRPAVTTHHRKRRRITATREDQHLTNSSNNEESDAANFYNWRAPEDEQSSATAMCEGQYWTASSEDENSNVFTFFKPGNEQSRVTATREDQQSPTAFLQDERKSPVAGRPGPTPSGGRGRGMLGAGGLRAGCGAKSLGERMAEYNAAQKLERRWGSDSNPEPEGKFFVPVGKPSSSTLRLGGPFLPVGPLSAPLADNGATDATDKDL
ncbi:hypothetical protein BKA80DRAFT_321988 [Phyllosticta citrichinensis]